MGVSKQPKMFIQVLLPDPLGPITATNSPGKTRRATPRRASMAALPVPYTLVTPLSSMSGSAVVSLESDALII